VNKNVRRIQALLAIAAIVMLVGRVATASDDPAPAPAAQGEPVGAHHGSLFVDPLGFLLFGPTLGVEVGSDKVSGTLYGRWFNVGLLSQALFLNKPQSFDFSYGLGLKGRYYFWGALSGPHVGAGVEYLSSRVDDPGNLIVTSSHYLVPQVEGGYRLGLGAFYVGGAAALGYAFDLSSSVENLPGGMNASLFQVVSASKFYGSASLELGVYF
jgi:hypothetical protein